jgi:methionyl-tRNA synthetase
VLNVPKERKKNFFEKLLAEEINENLKKQIVNDLNRTINQNFEHLKGNNSLDEKVYENKKQSLYKILYALTNLDKEMGY